MSMHAICPQCGARLVYQGTSGNKVKPCPKCQTPIAFVMLSPETPSAPPVRIESEEVLAEIVLPEKPLPLARPSAAPAKSGGKAWWVILPIVAGGGGLLVLMVACAGVAALFSRESSPPVASTSSSRSYAPQPVYTEPAPTYTDPYVVPAAAPAYDWSTAPAAAPSAAPVDNLWNFNMGGREYDLQVAIEQDTKRLSELDAQLFVTGAAGGLGSVAERNAERADDQFLGALLNAGASSIKQQLQSERDAVQIRLNANRGELARLQAGS